MNHKLNDSTIALLEVAVEIINRDPDGGRLLISKNEDGTWMVGMEWGREAPDSPMAGAAAYGLEDTLENSLRSLVGELGK